MRSAWIVLPLALVGQSASAQYRPSERDAEGVSRLLHSARTYGEGPKRKPTGLSIRLRSTSKSNKHYLPIGARARSIISRVREAKFVTNNVRPSAVRRSSRGKAPA